MIKMILRATNKAKWAITMIMALFSIAINAQDNEILARSYYLQAQDAYSNGNNKTAINNLDKTVEYLGSTNAKIESLYVRVYNANGDLYKAKNHLNTYFELADSSHGDYNDMVRMVATLKDKIEAMQKKEGYKGNLINGKKEGEWEYYWSNGHLQQTVTYKNDKPISDYKLFYDKDWKKTRDKSKFAYYRVIAYENGKWTNPVRDYYAKGTLQMEAYYRSVELAISSEEDLKNKVIDNTPVKFFHKNGNLSQTMYYLNGQTNGEVKVYHKNGKLRGEYTKVNGTTEGQVKFYYDNGQLKEERTQVNGKIEGECKIYHKNGNLSKTAYYLDDEINGEVKEYHENGKLREEYTEVNGKKKGEVKTYYDNGQLKEYYFAAEDGIKYGESKTYYKNGQLEWEGSYYSGEAVGITNWYHSNGQLLRAIEFKTVFFESIAAFNIEFKTVFFKSIAAFDKEGNQLKKGTLKNGRGTLHLYDENGNLEKSMKFKDGLLIEESSTKRL